MPDPPRRPETLLERMIRCKEAEIRKQPCPEKKVETR
jgi:hypothetical protein